MVCGAAGVHIDEIDDSDASDADLTPLVPLPPPHTPTTEVVSSLSSAAASSGSGFVSPFSVAVEAMNDLSQLEGVLEWKFNHR